MSDTFARVLRALDVGEDNCAIRGSAMMTFMPHREDGVTIPMARMAAEYDIRCRIVDAGHQAVLLLQVGPDYTRVDGFPPELPDSVEWPAALHGNPASWAV
jgi:hypothetical protein